tara:strand:+ start:126 stop:1055 length:930 start_codon:yes stop_codon:yes gene_type:complete
LKYIVTGGAGFIGSNLVDRLLKDGNDVTVIDNLSSEESRYRIKSGKMRHWEENFPVIIEEDIATMTDFSKFNNADGVFHLAALPQVQPSIDNPIKYHSVNVNGTLNMLYACKVAKIKRFVFSSSSAVYGQTNLFPTPENAGLNPLSPYSLHKLIGEQYCKLFEDLYGIETFSLRYFNVFGERQPMTGPYSLVLGKFANQLLNDMPLTINGDGEQRRDFVYVGDVVEANIECISRKHTKNNIINIGSGRNLSVNELANILSKNAKKINQSPVIEPRETLADIKKAREILQWEPNIKIEDWISLYKSKLGI